MTQLQAAKRTDPSIGEAKLVNVPDSDQAEWITASLGRFGLTFTDDPEIVRFLHSVYPHDRLIGIRLGKRYLGTAASVDRSFIMPGGNAITVAGVTGVAVDQTAARQGLLRLMVQSLHRRAHDEGYAACVLGSSEWPIYGRFGYGPACWLQSHVSIDKTAVGWRPEAPGGELRPKKVEPDEARRIAVSHFAQRKSIAPGEVIPPNCYWQRFTATEPVAIQMDNLLGLKVDKPRRYDAIADRGVVGYHLEPDRTCYDTPTYIIHITDFLVSDDKAAAALWRHILGIDLVAEVRVARLPLDDPLRWWVRDARRIRSYQRDGLWLRPLDVRNLLEARVWSGSGVLVLSIHDSERFAHGTFRLNVESGHGRCVRLSDECSGDADLSMDVSSLGAIVLGGTSAAELVRSERIRTSDLRSAQLWDALATPERAPFCSYAF